MKIPSILSHVSFMAGQVSVYSDFDGTYCPASHASLHNPNENKFMPEYCSKIDKFLKATDKDLDFHITTGRTFGEYKAVVELLKERGFKLPLPQSFISKNGSDEFVRNGKSTDFYNNGIFPYIYEKPELSRESNIKNLTNWNGSGIKTYIRELAEKYKLGFVEADSEHSVRDYGENSLYSKGKLNPDEWRNLPQKDGQIAEHKIPIADLVMGARKDGNLKINLVFPPDYGYCNERNELYNNFLNDIKQYLNDRKVKYNLDWEIPSRYNHFRKHCNIVPLIEDKALTKLYDTKEALKKAIKNNDMVVVAGDGSNDFDMLNPLEYIDKESWNKYKKDSANKEFYEKSMFEKVKELKKMYDGKNPKLEQELTKNGLLKKIEELPIYGIVVKNDSKELNLLAEVFSKSGKIISVENGELDIGIKKVIEQHANKNSNFKNNMSDKFKSFIFDSGSNTKEKTVIICGTLAVVSVITACICWGHNVIKNKNLCE